MHVNYFQPSFNLLEKIRDGARVKKRYSPPATPCGRVIQHDEISVVVKNELREYRRDLTRWGCCVLYGRHSRRWHRCPHPSSRKLLTGKALTGFWPACPACGNKAKHDPLTRCEFARPGTGVPVKILLKACGATCCCGCRGSRHQRQGSAKLREAYPCRFGDAHLRTLQRRVKDWRGVMAKRLVYAASDEPTSERSEKVDLVLVGVGNKG